MTDPKHPIQPICTDEHGVTRFKRNAIVRFLLDNNGLGVWKNQHIDMNEIVSMQFSTEDIEQFYQLIGYSLGGFEELNFTTQKTCDIAERILECGETEDQARIQVLENELKSVKQYVKDLVSVLFDTEIEDE